MPRRASVFVLLVNVAVLLASDPGGTFEPIARASEPLGPVDVVFEGDARTVDLDLHVTAPWSDTALHLGLAGESTTGGLLAVLVRDAEGRRQGVFGAPWSFDAGEALTGELSVFVSAVDSDLHLHLFLSGSDDFVGELTLWVEGVTWDEEAPPATLTWL